MNEDQADAANGGAANGGAAKDGSGVDGAGAASGRRAEQDGFGRLLVERSGGIGGMLLVWEIDIDASSHRENLGRAVAELPWSEPAPDTPAPSGADSFAYFFESRYGRVRFGAGQIPQEWKRLVDEVREVTEPQRRPPG